ncbi:MAG: Type 1 glutamine amidotransferase-like domain-containing protein [Acholeplasmataceae bacterium]|nr:Type 1 glutamine amidotransferase-like domain-containing protein [Acholeplasmataceae bacterium]
MINILMSRGLLADPNMISNLKPIIQSNHKVLIVALSHFPKHIYNEETYNLYYEKGGEYYQKMIDSFLPYDIKESQIDWIHYFKDTPQSALKKIEKADILYFPGGSPDLMMKRIVAFGIKEAIEQHQKIYVGSSAGTMIQFGDYHISPDDDYKAFRYEKGLNLLSGFSIEVHYRRRKKQKAALRKVNRAFHHEIYAIPDDGALIVNENHIQTIGSAKKIYNKKGVVKSS